jgi:hypothetical protein
MKANNELIQHKQTENDIKFYLGLQNASTDDLIKALSKASEAME